MAMRAETDGTDEGAHEANVGTQGAKEEVREESRGMWRMGPKGKWREDEMDVEREGRDRGWKVEEERVCRLPKIQHGSGAGPHRKPGEEVTGKGGEDEAGCEVLVRGNGGMVRPPPGLGGGEGSLDEGTLEISTVTKEGRGKSVGGGKEAEEGDGGAKKFN